VAEVAEFTTTAVTLAPAPLARPEPAWAWMIAAYFCPFWSSWIFFAAEVLPSKNVSQFVVIWLAAEELPELLALAEVLAADELGGVEGADELEAGVVAEELELLLQAATVPASARPSAGAIIRRAKTSNRMTRLLVCVRCGSEIARSSMS
jgi:hypothetical protein